MSRARRPTLAAAGKKRETIRKSVKYLAAVLDERGRRPEPGARPQRVRLPHEEHDELDPPTAEHVEAVYRLLAPAVPAAAALARLVGRARRARSTRSPSATTTSATGASGYARRRRRRAPALWVELPDVLADALEATLPPREDRDPDAPLFPGVDRRPAANGDREGVQGGRRAGVLAARPPPPPDLLLHRQGRSWAEIARFVGQRKLSLTADTYTHVLIDGRELDYAELLR